jgi:hypothetical protein
MHISSLSVASISLEVASTNIGYVSYITKNANYAGESIIIRNTGTNFISIKIENL